MDKETELLLAKFWDKFDRSSPIAQAVTAVFFKQAMLRLHEM